MLLTQYTYDCLIVGVCVCVCVRVCIHNVLRLKLYL